MLKDETLCGMTLKRSKYMKYTKFRKVIPLRDREKGISSGRGTRLQWQHFLKYFLLFTCYIFVNIFSYRHLIKILNNFKKIIKNFHS